MPGAACATLAWLLAGAVYSLYLRYLARLASPDGAFEGVIVLGVWLYGSASVLLYGAELNVVFQERDAKTGP